MCKCIIYDMTVSAWRGRRKKTKRKCIKKKKISTSCVICVMSVYCDRLSGCVHVCMCRRRAQTAVTLGSGRRTKLHSQEDVSGKRFYFTRRIFISLLKHISSFIVDFFVFLFSLLVMILCQLQFIKLSPLSADCEV